MEAISPSDLKTILHSQRANLYYLEHCRVLVNGGRVEYVTDQGKRQLYWNIPIANTTSILLGAGTSITQAAMRELSKAGVLVGFCGGGGTPLFSANEMDVEVAWFAPQSEYRPTEYLQAWVRFWFDDAARLHAAKALQTARLGRIGHFWTRQRLLRDAGFEADGTALTRLLDASRQAIAQAPDVTALLTEEARLTKQLFRLAAQATKYGDFTRAKRGSEGIERPALVAAAIHPIIDAHLHLLGADTVAPQPACVRQVEGVAPRQFSKAMLGHIGLHGLLQTLLVGCVVAGRRRASTAEHTQRELHPERVGLVRKRRHVHRLQVGVFDGGIQLGRVLILGLGPVGDGAAHGFRMNRHRGPCLAALALALGPEALVEQRVGRIEFALEGENGSGRDFVGHDELLVEVAIQI